VREQARWFSDFRQRCIEYKSAYPDDYAAFPEWDTTQLGWQKLFDPITIPITETSFGVVHGDAHNGNYMMSQYPDGHYDMTVIDLDNAQKSWFIVDPGAVVFGANLQLYTTKPLERIPRINKFKEWFMDEYGWDITEEELKQGCKWRWDMTYYIVKGALLITPKDSPSYAGIENLLRLFDAGLIPSC